MRLIDADVLREEVNSWGMNDYEPSDFTDAIDDAPTVEAIPKDQYEQRLKADMVAMLTEIQSEIEELEKPHCHNASHADGCASKWRVEGVIQQKINALKEQEDGKKESGEQHSFAVQGIYLDRWARIFNIERNGMTDEQLREEIFKILKKALY